jgi:signal transduction histidine kinase
VTTTSITETRFSTRRRELARRNPERHGSARCTECSTIALDNARLTAELRDRRDEAAQSSARLINAAYAERRRLERDLHDGAQQRLVSVAIQLRLLADGLAPDSPEGQLLATTRQELVASMHELRELATGLHPTALDRGLDEALMGLASRAPLPVAVAVDLQRRPDSAIEVAAYYFVCETLTNVAKYAAATTATVTASHDGDVLVVEVIDDGVGGADPARGSGLRGLADRVEALGGSVRVSSPPGHGTAVRAEIPCPRR